MKKTWMALAAGVVVAVAAVVAWKCGLLSGIDVQSAAAASSRRGDKKADPVLEFMPQEVVQPVMASLADRVEFSGPLIAPQTALLRAKAGGTLLDLSVSEGSHVQAGQVLGHIELADLASRLAERRANLESMRAALVQAERSHASNERLAAQQFISSIALDNSRAALDTAQANVNAAQASLDTTRVALRDGTLVAPIAGIVAKRHALPGEKVSIEQQLLTIIDLARLELAGSVGTHEVSRLSAGMPVRVQVEGVADQVSGRIARIAPAAEPGTRSIGVTIELANPKELLRAGQYALARADLPNPVERLTLPVTAVGQTSGQDHVWVIESGALARRAVTLGRSNEREGRVEVLQGVTPGSQVLAARFENLREGAKAQIVASKTSPVASAAASTPTTVR